MDAHKGQLHFDLLKAIIISGEAPKAVCENVRHTIAGLFPNHEHRILDSIDPNWVGAVGAAQLAKAQIEYPDALEGWHTCILEPEFASGKHDEL